MKIIQHLEHSRLFRLVFLIAVSLGLRFLTFFRAVIDHDESTYMVIADALRRGAVYWVDVIDVKPIGIFWLFAGWQSLFGTSIFLMRVLASLFLAFTAFFLMETKLKMGSRFKAAWASGVLYLVLNCLYTFYGVSPNTETFFNFFTMAGFALAICFPKPGVYLLAGLLLGYGFIIKYVVLFDALVLGIFLLLLWLQQRPWRWQGLLALLLLAVGFALPFLSTYIWYVSQGHGETFLFYTFEVSSRYPVSANLWDYLKSILDFHLRFLPVAFFFYFSLIRGNIPDKARLLGILWISLAWIPVLLPGKFFGHYFMQLFLPFSFIAGEFFGRPSGQYPRFVRFILQPKVGYPLMVLLVLANGFFQKKDYIDRPDAPKRVAREMKAILGPDDDLYVGNYHPVLYLLLGKESPTPYIHRGLLWTEEHRYALNIDLEEEVKKIVDARPDFIIVQDSLENASLNREIRLNYVGRSLGETERGYKLYLYKRTRN